MVSLGTDRELSDLEISVLNDSELVDSELGTSVLKDSTVELSELEDSKVEVSELEDSKLEDSELEDSLSAVFKGTVTVEASPAKEVDHTVELDSKEPSDNVRKESMVSVLEISLDVQLET